MTGRNVDRVLMLAGLLILVALVLAATTEQSKASETGWGGYEPHSRRDVVYVDVVRVVEVVRTVTVVHDHEQLIMDRINELILDGTLIWEWDLPNELLPDEYKTEGN